MALNYRNIYTYIHAVYNIDVKSYMIHVKHCVCTKSTWVRTKKAALGATDFGGGYEMPGHGQWMQDYPFHSHHFNRRIMGKSWENPCFPIFPGVMLHVHGCFMCF